MANTPRLGRERSADRKRFVVGFAINEAETRVALIEKVREPEGAEMVGTFNGIGGKVAGRESYLDAMIREFNQEAGVIVPHWDLFAIIDGDEYRLFCYTSTVPDSTWRHVKTLGKSVTDEMVVKANIRRVLAGNAAVESRIVRKAKGTVVAADASVDVDEELMYYPDVPSLVGLALHVEHWRQRAVHIDRRSL